MSLTWSIPVVAAAVSCGLVLARARALEETSAELARSVARLRTLHRPLAQLRAATDETEARIAAFRERHPLRPADGDPGSPA